MLPFVSLSVATRAAKTLNGVCNILSSRFNFYSQAMLLYLQSVIMQLSDFIVGRDTFRCASVIDPL